ncbi:DUF1617 family protein [Vagococcus sp. BWB3-3]|uniref:DUF1617 family protein n=1 Tax=Vagococcus allomyrinae TaxID=2794353 RepID=A0A940P935_9ENTE|nr:DUF1617 family protein [Vagococcus allomyrinae]MBP1040360.1 DUF1617 family protein [Vagococcus allomyrinae]
MEKHKLFNIKRRELKMAGHIINFKNGELELTHKFLIEIKLKGRKSRSRSLLCNRINEKFIERGEQRTEIQKEYAKLREDDGEMIVDDTGTILFETDQDRKDCIKAINEHELEEVAIDCTEILSHMQTLLNALDELDDELSGVEAAIYDTVCEQLESLKFEPAKEEEK